MSQDLSFKECLDKALADEVADKESRDLTSSVESVHFTKNYSYSKKKGSRESSNSGKSNKCYRCGSEGHFADKCQLKDSGMQCGYCHRANHSTNECFKKKNDERKRQSVNYIQQNEYNENKQDHFEPMFVINEEEIQKPEPDRLHGPTHIINMVRQGSYKTDVILDGSKVSMEIDTGSGVTVVSKQDFDKMRRFEIFTTFQSNFERIFR